MAKIEGLNVVRVNGGVFFEWATLDSACKNPRLPVFLFLRPKQHNILFIDPQFFSGLITPHTHHECQYYLLKHSSCAAHLLAMSRNAASYSYSARQMYRPLPIPGLKSWSVYWSREHLAGFVAQQILQQPRHILQSPTRYRYEQRPRDCLWWTVSSNAMKAKNVVKSWTARRARRGIIAALEARGFDRDGRPLKHLKATDAGSEPLTGTLRVLCYAPSTEISFNSVKQNAQRVVDRIIEDLKSSPRPSRSFTTSNAAVRASRQAEKQKSLSVGYHSNLEIETRL